MTEVKKQKKYPKSSTILTWRSFLLKEHIEVTDFLAIHFALQNKIRMGASIQHPDFIYNLFGKEVNGGKEKGGEGNED